MSEKGEEAGTLFRESEIENSQGNIFSLQDPVINFFIGLSRPRIYEHLGKNPGIIYVYWLIRQHVTKNMCTSYWIVSLVVLLEVSGSNMYIFSFHYSSCFYLPSQG